MTGSNLLIFTICLTHILVFAKLRPVRVRLMFYYTFCNIQVATSQPKCFSPWKLKLCIYVLLYVLCKQANNQKNWSTGFRGASQNRSLPQFLSPFWFPVKKSFDVKKIPKKISFSLFFRLFWYIFTLWLYCFNSRKRESNILINIPSK